LGGVGEKELLKTIGSMSDVRYEGSISRSHWDETRLVLEASTKDELDRMIRIFLDQEKISDLNWREEVFYRATKSFAGSFST